MYLRNKDIHIWIARSIDDLYIYNSKPYRDILYSPFALSCNGSCIRVPDGTDEKLIGKRLDIKDDPIKI